MKRIITLLATAATLLVNAQNEKPFITLHLKSGDVVSGISDIGSIPFRTAYGDLAFPIKEVSEITLGVNTSGVDRASVNALLERVQNSSDATAFDQLIKLTESAVPLVKDFMRSNKYKKVQQEYTVDMVFEILLARNGVGRSFKTTDVLNTTGETSIEGNYDFQSLTLESDYGKVTVNRSKIASITVSFRDVVNANSGTYKLYGNLNISGNTNGGWLNTGILVKSGQNFSIHSSGTVTLQSLSGNTYTPDGGVNGSPGPMDDKPSYGCVVYKIGESGTVMKAGENFGGKAQGTGIIYISISESVYNAANSGMYSCKVSVQP